VGKRRFLKGTPLFLVGLFIFGLVAESLAREYTDPGQGWSYSQGRERASPPENYRENGNGGAADIGSWGWIPRWIFMSWLTPLWIVYLFYRFVWPRIKNRWTQKERPYRDPMSPVTISGGDGGCTTAPSRSLRANASKNVPATTFADVILPEEVMEELREVVDFLKDPSDAEHFDIRPPKGVLLSGPPGCGKTLIAKAIAGEAGVNFYAYCGSDFVNKYVGTGADTIRQRFGVAKENTPCIVFIDEIDSLARQRFGGGSEGGQEYDHTLNQLLSEIQGFHETSGLVFLAATNREDLLDPALLRPGRLDRKIIIDAPDFWARESILRLHSKKKPLGTGVNITGLARSTAGFSGADLENLMNEAAMVAFRRSKKTRLSIPIISSLIDDKGTIEQWDVEEARQKVVSGLSRKSSCITDDEKIIVAFHEAGHALVAKKISGPKDDLDIVSIIPRGRSLGITVQTPEYDRRLFSQDYLLNQVCILYGGRLAEELKFGKGKITTGAGNDIDRAMEIVKKMVCEWGMSNLDVAVFRKPDGAWWHRPDSERQAREIDREVDRIIKVQLAVSRKILEDNRLNLELVACALIAKETLTNVEIDLLLEKGRDALENIVGTLVSDVEKKGILARFVFWK